MAKTGKFRCHSCGRIFAMAAHLGRHTSAAHTPKGQGAARAKKRRRRSAQVNRPVSDGRTRLLDQLSACHDELAAQQTAVDAQLTGLDQAIAILNGSAATAKTTAVTCRRTRIRRRARASRTARAGSLRAYVQQVMRHHRGPLTLNEVTAAVRKAGCQSRNRELPKTIGKLLRKMPGVVKVRPGVYQMK